LTCFSTINIVDLDDGDIGTATVDVQLTDGPMDDAGEMNWLRPVYQMTLRTHPSGLEYLVKEWYAEEDTVWISAVVRADSIFRFQGWSGDIQSASETVSFIMTRPFTIQADFQLITHRLLVEIQPHSNFGQIEVIPNLIDYIHNALKRKCLK